MFVNGYEVPKREENYAINQLICPSRQWCCGPQPQLNISLSTQNTASLRTCIIRELLFQNIQLQKITVLFKIILQLIILLLSSVGAFLLRRRAENYPAEIISKGLI